jgi:hypothetical protein
MNNNGAIIKNFKVTATYLRQNPNHIFVFGDNELRIGKGGAAALRDFPNTYGFITKKFPNQMDNSFYKCDDYPEIYQNEITRFQNYIEHHMDYKFLISPVGSGLANRFAIWEHIIKPNMMKDLEKFNDYIIYCGCEWL